MKVLARSSPGHRSLVRSYRAPAPVLACDPQDSPSSIKQLADKTRPHMFLISQKEALVITVTMSSSIAKIEEVHCCTVACIAGLPSPNFFKLYTDQRRSGLQLSARYLSKFKQVRSYSFISTLSFLIDYRQQDRDRTKFRVRRQRLCLPCRRTTKISIESSQGVGLYEDSASPTEEPHSGCFTFDIICLIKDSSQRQVTKFARGEAGRASDCR